MNLFIYAKNKSSNVSLNVLSELRMVRALVSAVRRWIHHDTTSVQKLHACFARRK